MTRGPSFRDLDAAAEAVLAAGRRLIYQLKFDEDQPRVPAGEPGGGRWTSGSSDSGSEGIFAMAERLSLLVAPQITKLASIFVIRFLNDRNIPVAIATPGISINA